MINKNCRKRAFSQLAGREQTNFHSFGSNPQGKKINALKAPWDAATAETTTTTSAYILNCLLY